MKYFLSFLCAVIVLGFAFPGRASAQWPQGKGNGYFQLSYGYASASNEFDSSGNIVTLADNGVNQNYSENAIYTYLEYGLSEKLTLIASTFYKDIIVEEPSETLKTNGLSDLTLSLRSTIYKSDAVVISPQLGLKFPTGYDESASPPLGSGAVDFLANITAGVSFYPVPLYIGTGFGIKVRGGSQQDELFGHLESGYYIHSKVLLRGRINLLESTTNSGVEDFGASSIPGEQGFIKTGPGLTYSVTEQISLSVDGRWTVDGRTASELTSLFAGISFSW